MSLVDTLHELPHFGVLGVWMLPELPRCRLQTHIRRLDRIDN